MSVLSVASVGNIHIAVIDKTFDPSNRTQPICLIPLKTVKEDLTCLSGSVNSQMLLDNLSGESICQLAVDHLLAVLGKLKSTPPVNLKVVFSSVKAVASPPLLREHHDQDSSDAQEVLLDETTDSVESRTDGTPTEDAKRSAFEIALRQVLDDEKKILPEETLVSLKEEEQCPEKTDQTGSSLDSLVDRNCFQFQSSTLELDLATASNAETETLGKEEGTSLLEIHKSNLQPVSEDVASSETFGSQCRDPCHSQTHTCKQQPTFIDAARSETSVSLFKSSNNSKTNTFNEVRSDVFGRLLTDPIHSQADSSDLQPMHKDATGTESLRSQFTGHNQPQTHSSNIQPLSRDTIRSSSTSLSQPRDPNYILIHPSNLQAISKDATGLRNLRTQFRDPNEQSLQKSPSGTKPDASEVHVKVSEKVYREGRISTLPMKDKIYIVTSQDRELVVGGDAGNGTVKAKKLTQSNFTFTREGHKSICLSDQLPTLVSFSPYWNARKAQEIPATYGSEIHMEDQPSTIINQKPFNTNQMDISPEIPVGKRSLIKCNRTSDASGSLHLPVASNYQINNPGVDSPIDKLKFTIKDEDSATTKNKSPPTLKKMGNRSSVKRIKRGERCRCINCGHYSISYANLLKHTVKRHMKTVPCTCTDCGEEIKLPVDYQFHQLKHTEATQEDKDTLNRLAYTIKRKETATKKKHVCKICGETVTSNSDLKTHLRRKHGEKPFHCIVCHSKFLTKSALTVHLKTHSRDKPFACTLCPKAFTKNFSLKQHMWNHTAEKIHRCLMCTRTFPAEDLLAQHVSQHAAKGRSPPVCEICQKIFSSRQNLRRHMVVHTGERPYKCDICDWSFGQRDNLTAHRRRHSQKIEYVCCKSGEHFMSGRKRQIFICNTCQTADKYSSTTCYVCKKVCKTLAALKVHLQSHPSERFRLCSICGKTFDKPLAFHQHIQTHSTAKSRVCCAFCGKVFNTRTGLKLHERRHCPVGKTAM